MMRALALVLIWWAPLAHAETELRCVMQNPACSTGCDTLAVVFSIDPLQFTPPLDPNDPPRRQVTMVQMGDARFSAEAILMAGGERGFYANAEELGSQLMIVQRDGFARLSVQPQNQKWIGMCDID